MSNIQLRREDILMSDFIFIKSDLTENYSLLANEIRTNPNLDAYDRDLFWFLVSRPPMWELNTKSLATQLKISIGRISKSSRALQKEKYLVINKSKTGKSKWTLYATNLDYELANNEVIKSELKKAKEKLSTGKQAGNVAISPYSTRSNKAIEKPNSTTPNKAQCNVLVSIDLLVSIYLSQEPDENQKNTQQQIREIAKLCDFNDNIKKELIGFQGHHTEKGSQDKTIKQWLGAWQLWLSRITKHSKTIYIKPEQKPVANQQGANIKFFVPEEVKNQTDPAIAKQHIEAMKAKLN